MAKAKRPYYELDEIKHDLESLKSNVVELTHHIQENGKATTVELAKTAQKRLEKFKSRSARELHKMERHVKEKPAQSLAIAFATGFVVSYLFGRRR